MQTAIQIVFAEHLLQLHTLNDPALLHRFQQAYDRLANVWHRRDEGLRQTPALSGILDDRDAFSFHVRRIPFRRIGKAFKEIGNGPLQGRRYLEQLRCTDAIGTYFVFLDLLKCHSKAFRKGLLGHSLLLARKANLLPNVGVDGMAPRSTGRCIIRFSARDNVAHVGARSVSLLRAQMASSIFIDIAIIILPSKWIALP